MNARPSGKIAGQGACVERTTEAVLEIDMLHESAIEIPGDETAS
jgi:hypothetical protein